MNQVEQQNVNQLEEVTKRRYFKCSSVGGNDGVFGRYAGLKPKQAANKAFTAIIKANGGNTTCVGKPFKFTLMECTRGSRCKVHSYEGVRTQLQTPVVVTIKSNDGQHVKNIEYKYVNKVKKIKLLD